MPHVIPVRCPHCGAALQVDPRADSATCAYCGTTSLLRGKGTVVPGGASVITVGSSNNGARTVLLVAGALVAISVIVGLYAAGSGAPSASPPSPVPTSAPGDPLAEPPKPAPPAPAVTEPAPGLTVERIETGRRPLLVDVDADATVDVVALTRVKEADAGRDVFAAFSGATGALLWHVDAPEDARETVAAAVHGRLLLLTRTGQVIGHDLAGAQQWSTALGDRGLRFCGATQPDSVQVPTADERVLLLDVKTGKQSPTRATADCTAVPTDHEFVRRDPRDRNDPRAPIGVLGIRCGSTRVMGSQNYTVPDACRARAKFDPDRLGGLAAHALWQTADGWLLFGVRDPGINTPLVARVQGKALAWKADVPEGNPLLASEGGPSPVALAGDVVIAGYRLQADSKPKLTAFALADGKRLWHVDAPGGKSINHVAAANGHALVYADGAVHVLDLATGATLRTIGPTP